jgi:Holliday junction resolvase
MSASQRRKGHNFERKVAKELREVGINACRGRQDWSGKVEPDIVILDGRFSHFWPELKVGKAPSIWGALKQAIGACSKEHVPIVVAKRDRSETIVALRWDDFLELLQQKDNNID